MAEDVLNPEYWADRLRRADPANLHHSIFRCPLDRWRAIEDKHRRILDRVLEDYRLTHDRHPSILDAGCGYGRLLTLLPSSWSGIYRGLDLSYEFIKLARNNHPEHVFGVGDLRALPYGPEIFDIGVLISIRPMVKRNLGEETWSEMERELRRVCRKLLYLEYDVFDEGSIESWP